MSSNKLDEEDLKSHLELLKLEELSEEWVQDIWDREFMDDLDIPKSHKVYIKNTDLTSTIQNIETSLSTIFRDKESTDSSEDESSTVDSWKSLVNVIKHQGLIALLFHLINAGDKNITKESDRVCAICSARLYFVMLTIPGSKAYSIFHCQMYVTCLKIFKFGEKLLEHEKEYNDLRISKWINHTNQLIKKSLDDFMILIEKFDLKCNTVILEETVNCLVDLVYNVELMSRLNIDKSMLSKISKSASKCIDQLAEISNSEPDKSVIFTIFKFLLPKLTSTSKETRRSMFTAQTSEFAYCGILLDKYGENATDGLVCLIQHLCCDLTGMESRYRNYRVKIIIGLMAKLPLQSYTGQLHWIIKLSRNSSLAWRTVALDVIKFIIMGDERNSGDNIDNIEEVNQGIRLSNLGTDDDDDDDDDDDANDFSKSISIHHNVAHKDLLKVIVERCQDIACNIRVQALSILVECMCTNNAILNSAVEELFQNEESLLQIAKEKMQDERANVRKNAVKLLGNVLKTQEHLLIKENLQLLITSCRDANVVVRISSINVLTNLATYWRNATIADAWLDGPLNQLFDPESKVQSLVLEGVQRLLFTNLSAYSVQSSTGPERFPWILLNSILRKNLRRHLARACLLLSKQQNKFLNNNLVEILSSHIRTENNFSCWILLSCIARYIPFKNISFVVDYFYSRTSDPMFEDVRLLILVQEVLSEWCRMLTTEESNSLQSELINSLRNRIVPPGATRSTVTLLMRLNSDCDWASSLMEDYESQIFNYVNCDEAQIEISPDLINTFGDITLASDKRPTANILDILLSIVRSFDSQECDMVSSKAQSAALIALGKFSLREKSIAESVAKLCSDVLASVTCPMPLRINAMCILTDISTRFSVVTPKLSGMYISLGSSDLNIRRTAVQLVTELLVTDFLKLRKSLYFHYFSLLCDPDEKIRDIVSYYLFRCLIKKENNILYSNFIRSIYYYNNYNDPFLSKEVDVSEEERKLFSLEGEEKRNQRYTLYDAMLTHMSDLQRLNTQVRICNQAVIIGEVGATGIYVLKDFLGVLRKLSQYTQNREHNDDLATRVRSNIVAQKMKINDIEKVVPLVMRLYRQLKLINSPLVSNIVTYACDLLKDYKHEIEEVFDTEEDLFNEIKKFQMKTPVASTSSAGPSTSTRSTKSHSTPKKRKSNCKTDAKRRLDLEAEKNVALNEDDES